MWQASKEGRTGACTYCVSADGLHHLHIVLECSASDQFRYAVVQDLFKEKMHIQPTRGNKNQAEDYINKWGQYEEKGEVVLAKYQHGEIKGSQGNRTDIASISVMVKEGLTPAEIFRSNDNLRKYEKIVKDIFYDYREQHTPYIRNINVIWHAGETGTGKSYEVVAYDADHPGEVKRITDYAHGFDKYDGESVISLEEFRGQLPFAVLLNILDCYKTEVAARYSNVIGLWTTVHITSPFFPDEVYSKMQEKYDMDSADLFAQLLRRINTIKYHYINDGHRYSYSLPAKEFISAKITKQAAELDFNNKRVLTKCIDDSNVSRLYKSPAELAEHQSSVK
jgi:hypothetical protein